ncbi:MAG: DUF4402 domain-containing protein [Rhodospirillales bacterium]|nr:DUF4402 domain-containing protein [Rhodospirillales bacterium]
MRTELVPGQRACLAVTIAATLLSTFIPTPATTQAAVSLDVRREMHFGEFAASVDGSGTVVLSPNGDTVSASGPVILFSSKDVQRARIKIVGDKKTYVIVSLPSSITIKSSASNQTMTVSNFTMDVSNPVYLGNNGQKIINIGATLTIGTNQQAGSYTTNNSFTFVVEYL